MEKLKNLFKASEFFILDIFLLIRLDGFWETTLGEWMLFIILVLKAVMYYRGHTNVKYFSILFGIVLIMSFKQENLNDYKFGLSIVGAYFLVVIIPIVVVVFVILLRKRR